MLAVVILIIIIAAATGCCKSGDDSADNLTKGANNQINTNDPNGDLAFAQQPRASSGLSTGAIIGIVAGGVAALAIIIGVSACCCCCPRNGDSTTIAPSGGPYECATDVCDAATMSTVADAKCSNVVSNSKCTSQMVCCTLKTDPGADGSAALGKAVMAELVKLRDAKSYSFSLVWSDDMFKQAYGNPGNPAKCLAPDAVVITSDAKTANIDTANYAKVDGKLHDAASLAKMLWESDNGKKYFQDQDLMRPYDPSSGAIMSNYSITAEAFCAKKDGTIGSVMSSFQQ